MTSDRIFGLVVILVALAYIAGAMQIQVGLMPDPVGSKTFPVGIASIAALCGVIMLIRPDPDPEWPGVATFGALAVAVVVLIAYAYMLKPLGFLIPTAIVAAILSFQIRPRPLQALITGIGLSAGLFIVFKYALGLGLVPVPKSWLL